MAGKKKKISDIDLGATLRESLEIKKEFISTGSLLLDCSLGGGVLEGRIFNAIGDSSSGKTLIALSIAQQFQKKYPEGKVIFDDAEAALDPYWVSNTFGLNLDKTTVPSSDTVEEFFQRLKKVISLSIETKIPYLYILDSLDALDTKRTDEANTDITIPSNMRDKLDKASIMSEQLKKVNKKLVAAKVTLIVVSQLKTKIGVLFGDKTTIAGGKSLIYYSSQRLKMAERAKLKKGEKIIGLTLKSKIVKNKVGFPFQESEFNIYFKSGIDDLSSCIKYLKDNTKYFGKGNLIEYENKSYSRDKFVEMASRSKIILKDMRKQVRKKWAQELE